MTAALARPESTGRPRLIAVGAICSATLFRVDRIPPAPAKLLPTARLQLVDGMAVSAAYAFSRLGGTACVWSRIGDDWLGRMAAQSLADEGFDVSGVHIVPGMATSQVAILIEESGDRLVVPYHDPHADASAAWLPLSEIAKADFLHCETRWVEGAEAALKAARAHGVPSMVDGEVAPREALQRLIPLADYAVFSDAGLRIYAACDDVEAALLQVGAGHRGHVGASCGADGYLWYEAGRIRKVAAPRVTVVDTLAAGDVFHGALALALMEGKGIEAAARFACAAASLKCTHFGGRLGCPLRGDIETFLANGSRLP